MIRFNVVGIRWKKSIDSFKVFKRCAWSGGNTDKVSSRQQKINDVNMTSQSKLYHIDNKFHIFNDQVTRVLDLGYVPGNWLEFAKFRLCSVYGLEEIDINDKCDLLGFDLLFDTPPLGTSSIQGNIFSKTSHKSIIQFFKDSALRRKEENIKKLSKVDELNKSYFVKEQTEIEMIESHMTNLKLDDELDYKPQLILSDLAMPFNQERGYFNNTNTRPYLRFSSNEVLSRPMTEKVKSAIDLADATLVLTCDLLKDGGNLVLRLPAVDKDDDEFSVLLNRCRKLFSTVSSWPQPLETFLKQNPIVQQNDPTAYRARSSAKYRELFLICQDKKDIDKLSVFMN